MAIRAAALPYVPRPIPRYHDEFAYLLGADTFTLGRLTNPPHPMWIHFETFHVNQLPTYSSKYPPMQSLFLAFGQKVLGHPWFGVWLSFGLFCASLCWMLQGWMPPVWALLGTLVAMGQIGVFGYWMNSYWGGAVPALGGCLVLGALPRLARKTDVAAAVFGAVGLLVLANSRPFEGLITSLAAAAALLWWRRRYGLGIAGLFERRTLLPASIICGLGLAAAGYYNYRATGSAVLMPYLLNQRTYNFIPLFWIQALGKAPAYHHEVIRRFWLEYELNAYLTLRSHPLRAVPRFFRYDLSFYFSTLSVFLSLVVTIVTRSAKIRIALAICTVLSLALMMGVTAMGQPHYFAPAAGLLFLPVMHAVRWMRLRGGASGPLIALLYVGLVFTIGMSQAVSARSDAGKVSPAKEIGEQLARQGGRHLVIVRYGPKHNFHDEWVYNRADIDASTVIWARDMTESQNRELIDYYRDRKVWLVQPDAEPVSLEPYPQSASLE
jgi:hypothetical protein